MGLAGLMGTRVDGGTRVDALRCLTHPTACAFTCDLLGDVGIFIADKF